MGNYLGAQLAVEPMYAIVLLQAARTMLHSCYLLIADMAYETASVAPEVLMAYPGQMRDGEMEVHGVGLI